MCKSISSNTVIFDADRYKNLQQGKLLIAWWYNLTTDKAQKIGTLNKKLLKKFQLAQEPDHNVWAIGA